MLRHVPNPESADLIVGHASGDDALVWRRPDGRALVSTCDFFAPVVDDPYTWGRISAANAASDVYAMGGTPLFALNLVSWPAALDLDVLGEVLRGGSEMAAEGGWVVGGGHTVDGPEPHYGQAVTGEVDERRLLTNAGGRPGDVLILTKPIGTGIVATALKRSPSAVVGPGGRLEGIYAAAVAAMTTLNRAASRIALEAGAHACTDVTGFGLLGHLHKLALASGVRAVIDPAEVPLIEGVGELLAEGFLPGGTERNLAFVEPVLDAGGHAHDTQLLLADAQTSGGLLFSVTPDNAGAALSALGAAGLLAEDVGELIDPGEGSPGDLLLR